jgi:hypothetical protein
MTIQDIFRQMLDSLDGVEHTTGNPANAVDGTGTSMMVVPTDNADHSDQEHDCGCSGECECDDAGDVVDYEDEGGDSSLSDMRHLAGIQPIAVVQI